MKDLESPLRQFVQSIGYNNVYEAKFPPEKINDIEITVRREGIGTLQKYLPIDVPRIRIQVRANNIAQGRETILNIVNNLNRLQNENVFGNYIFWSELGGGPELVTDPQSGEQVHTAYFLMKTKEEE